jgi:hypothetical protein
MSWVIVEKATNKAIYETFNYEIAICFNSERCEILPVMEYLRAFNNGKYRGLK